MNISVDELRSIQLYVNYIALISLDEVLFKSDEEDMYFKNVIVDENSPQPDTLLEEKEKLHFLQEGINMMSDKDKLLLNLYYYEKLTLKEIGAILSVSESRVSQLHSRAIIRLRENLKKLKYI